MLALYNCINWDIDAMLSQVLRSSEEWSWDLVLAATVPPCPSLRARRLFPQVPAQFQSGDGSSKRKQLLRTLGTGSKRRQKNVLKFNTHGGNIRHLGSLLPFSLSNLTANYISDFDKSTQDCNKWSWEFQATDGELSISLVLMNESGLFGVDQRPLACWQPSVEGRWLMEGAGLAFPVAAELEAVATDWVFSWLSQEVANVEGIHVIIRKAKKELTWNSSKEVIGRGEGWRYAA